MHSKKTIPVAPVQQRHSAVTSEFPPHWGWLVDELIPQYVKEAFSPKESWKNKPFSDTDANFFFKGIEALSELFTEERSKGIANYFKHPKYRSSYLLYFLPLQAAKFLALFDMYPDALNAAVEHGHETGVLRVADLGAGPGTASLSLLLKVAQLPHPPKVEFIWFDVQSNVMKDGIELITRFTDNFQSLRGRVDVKAYTVPWWKSGETLGKEDLSLVLMGNVLNEGQLITSHHDLFWSKIFGRIQGGGVLMLEPAARGPSQMISKIRDYLFEKEWFPKEATSVWGPCLHAGACPMSSGRDWCHFSVPSRIPSRWFKRFSILLSSEKQWLKFSYFWLASASKPAPLPTVSQRRVLTDPLNQGPRATVLLCEPEVAHKWTISADFKPRRGDLIDIEKAQALAPAPSTLQIKTRSPQIIRNQKPNPNPRKKKR